MKPFDYNKYLKNNPLLKENVNEKKNITDFSINGVDPEMFELEDTIDRDEKGNVDMTNGWPRLYSAFMDKDAERVNQAAEDLQFILRRDPKKMKSFDKFVKTLLAKVGGNVKNPKFNMDYLPGADTYDLY